MSKIGVLGTGSWATALSRVLIDNQNEVQTIVVENEIPDINYKNTNIIHFTKEKGNGRYGFLWDVTD